MTIEALQTLTEDQLEDLKALWNTEYPASMRHAHRSGLLAYLSGLESVKHWLLRDEVGAIQGWAFSFDRDGSRWFAMLLGRAIHGKGFGRALLDHLRTGEERLQGWVIDHPKATKQDGEPYRSPLGFYLKCGFSVDTGTRLESDHVSAVRIHWNVNARPGH